MATIGGSVRDRIIDIIRQRRLRMGDLMPTEQDLMAELRVSRNTVREAIRELRTLGIVDVRHGHGTFVGNASIAALSETLVFRVIAAEEGEIAGLEHLVDFRELLETASVETMAGTVPEESLTHLRELCDLMTDMSERVRADREFHRELYRNSPNPFVREFVDVFWDAYHAVHSELRQIGVHAAEATRDAHLAIVDALASGDGVAARHAMTAHFADLHARIAEAREE